MCLNSVLIFISTLILVTFQLVDFGDHRVYLGVLLCVDSWLKWRFLFFYIVLRLRARVRRKLIFTLVLF